MFDLELLDHEDENERREDYYGVDDEPETVLDYFLLENWRLVRALAVIVWKFFLAFNDLLTFGEIIEADDPGYNREDNCA